MREPMPPAPPNTLAALDRTPRCPGLPEALELEKFLGAVLDLTKYDIILDESRWEQRIMVICLRPHLYRCGTKGSPIYTGSRCASAHRFVCESGLVEKRGSPATL